MKKNSNLNFEYFLKKNEKKVIILFIILLFICLDFVLTNFMNYFDFSLTCKNRNLKLIAESNSVYHHGFKKNEIGRGYGCEKIITNSLGFKDKITKNINNINTNNRILFIGDSFTEGVGLNYEDTFVGIFDDFLNNANVEVLNAGRSSYSPIIHWRKTKYLLENEFRFNHLYIFLDISDPFDEFYNYELDKDENVIKRKSNNYVQDSKTINPKMSVKKIKILIKNNFTLLYFISDYIYSYYKKSINESGEWFIWTRSEYERWTIEKHLFEKYAEQGVNIMKLYMDKIVLLSKKYNFKITIAVYPRPTQIWNEDLNSIHVDIWNKWADKNNIKFLNLFPIFIEKDQNLKQRYKTLKKYYLKGDPHFNKLGNKMIANEIIKNY